MSPLSTYITAISPYVGYNFHIISNINSMHTSMKRIAVSLIGAAILSVMTVAAQTNAFTKNLQVGSSGADVTSLQTWLIGNGYHIPSIESGAASKGRFGAQTKAAVQKYQAASGLPSTGFVGPLTRGKLN